MKAMILAAGFGTRLREITSRVPKPLVRVGRGKRIIDTVIDTLIEAGIYKIAVNLHYKGELIREYLENKYKWIEWKFYYEKEILGTGGGLRNAKDFFYDEDNFIVINSDILIFTNINEILKEHERSNSIASLVVFENREDPRAILYDRRRKRIVGFSVKDKLSDCEEGTFTGIQVLNSKIFNYMKGKDEFFSIIEVYDDILKRGEKLSAIEYNGYWRDLGTPESLKEGRKDFKVFSFVERELGDKILKIENTFKGGSSKRVFRIISEGVSRVGIISSKEEIKALNSLSRFFYDKAFPVPSVIKAEKEWLLMEDGGANSLLDIVRKYEKRGCFPLSYYKKAIDYLEELSKIDVKNFPINSLYQRGSFDLENIISDIKYFNNYYYDKRLNERDIESIANKINNSLTKHPLSIMHRDYQSTNILINHNGEIRIIDYQTMRIGFSVYDLASLILDSYIPFDESIIDELKKYFFSLKTFENYDDDVFWSAALIRILQNLGAFSKLGKDSEFFSSKIKKAEKRLEFILKNIKDRELVRFF